MIHPGRMRFMRVLCAFASALGFALGLAGLTAALALPAQAAAPVRIVAAENIYGGIAERIGGRRAEVVSILNNPDQDPHLFETSPAVMRQITDARIVIVNGAGYDPWMAKLLAAAPRPGRIVIDVSRLVASKPGGNPHLWYDPAVMPKLAQALAEALIETDPGHAADYRARLAATQAALASVAARATVLRAKWAGTPVTATEPVFGLMAEAIGLTMRNRRFQTAMMNDTEPSARDLAAFEDDLKRHKVKALIYNRQVSDKLTERLLAIAKEAKIPVVAVTETQPADLSFEAWMLSQLDALDRALAGHDS
jgi:zinc/manganese transport system substrate-binding protein